MSDASSMHVHPTREALMDAVHQAFLGVAASAIESRGGFTVALAGGSTPADLYRRLAIKGPDWSRTTLLFGDERSVGPADAQSNYRMAADSLLQPAGVDASRVLRIEGELPPQEAAERYEARLREALPPDGGIDLVLLGLGDDAHTASLFPGTKALDEQDRWVVANEVPQHDTWRITMSYPLLNAAQQVWFLVAGAGKADAVTQARSNTANIREVPSAGIRPVGELRFWLDEAAASGR